jgi:hypothetical protein
LNKLIVDASVAAKWFIEEEHSEAALSVLDEKHQLHAPDFLLLEINATIWKWIRRNAISLSEANDVWIAFRQYPIQYHPFASLLDTAFAIANQTGRSVYDCLYIALAAVIKGGMVTADRALYDAVKNGPFTENVVWIEDVG